MCKIADFSGPLEIAFGLSAVFYYLELRSLAEDRTRAALTGHDQAIDRNIKQLIDRLIKTVVDTASAVLTSIMATISAADFLHLIPRLRDLLFCALRIGSLKGSERVTGKAEMGLEWSEFGGIQSDFCQSVSYAATSSPTSGRSLRTALECATSPELA